MRGLYHCQRISDALLADLGHQLGSPDFSGAATTKERPSPAVGPSGISMVFVPRGEGIAAAGGRLLWVDVVMY
jgi:hypothetical protein